MSIPIITPAITVTGTGTTLQAYYRRLAAELGFWQLTVTSAEASGGDAARVVIANELRDDEMGYGLLGAPWLYVASGDQAMTQRRMLDPRQADGGVGYQGPLGALVLSRPFDAALESNAQIEASSPLPIRDHLGVRGIVTFCNEALARIWVEARASFTGNGTYEHDLAAYPYIKIRRQMRGIYDTVWTSAGYPAELSPFDYRVVTNGVTRTLITNQAYTTADTFSVDVAVRADALVYDGSAWVYTTVPGLQEDDWQAAALIEHVCAFGMVKALQYLSRYVKMTRNLSSDEKSGWLEDIADRRRIWGPAAAKIKMDEMPEPMPDRAPSVVYAGASSRWS